ncbi:MAG: ABC transporter permease [Alphaproteobacteria bacterium]
MPSMRSTSSSTRVCARWRDGTPVARPSPHLVIGLTLVGGLLAAAVLSLAWAPYPVEAMAVGERLAPPSPAHWLGTDHFGRDVLSLILAGSRTAVLVGLVAVGLGMAAGVALGLLAAAAGGRIDEAVMRASDTVFAFPAVVSAVLVTALLGPGAVNAVLAIAIFNVPVFARVARAAALQVWARDYARAALALGKSPLAVTRDHVLPNIAGVLIVQAAVQFGLAILAEAALSYLGIGAQPPEPSWGRMLSDAQTYMFTDPGLALYPGLAISAAVLGCNLLGDGLRDALDPRLGRVVRRFAT